MGSPKKRLIEDDTMQLFIDTYLKMFFVLTPFFVVSVFLSMTRELPEGAKRKTALRVALAVIVIVFALFFFGRYIFAVFDITLDAFKIGAGLLLFLSAVSLVQGAAPFQKREEVGDISVVPLAIPVTVGPATTGVLLVMGAELDTASTKFIAGGALLAAIVTVGLLLYLAGGLERRLGQTGLSILSKITGLMLASIAAQLVFTGIKHFLR